MKTRAAIQKLLNYSKNRVISSWMNIQWRDRILFQIHHMVGKGLLGENEGHQIIEVGFFG